MNGKDKDISPAKASASLSTCDFKTNVSPDPKPFLEFPVLHDAFSELEHTVWPVFCVADSEAIRQQAYHRIIAKIALTCGVVAVVAAILQLALTGACGSQLSTLAEVLALVLCLAAVAFGILTSRQHRWLIHRHIAECCRNLVFQSLTWPNLWDENLQSWKSALSRRVSELGATDSSKSIRAWMEYEPLVSSPPFSATRMLKPGLDALKGYYGAKRLDVQIAYFSCRAKEQGHQASVLQRLPMLCFFGSVIFALAHFAAELSGRTSLRHLGHWCIVFAATLPVLGAGIRSWLLAFEFARSASLFRAKARTLTDFSQKLSTAEGTEILQIINQCELFFQEEHRDWLRLVYEAEWFG